MKEIRIRELSQGSFAQYGSYAQMVEPEGPRLGQKPCEFFRDRGVLALNTASVAFSVTRVCRRPLVIADMEYHSHTGEAILPLDGDIIIHIAYATPKDIVPLDSIEAFLVPQGTLVILRPGVWHSGPFCVNAEHVNILVALPERTYANDCTVFKIPEEQQLKII